MWVNCAIAHDDDLIKNIIVWNKLLNKQTEPTKFDCSYLTIESLQNLIVATWQ